MRVALRSSLSIREAGSLNPVGPLMIGIEALFLISLRSSFPRDENPKRKA